MNVLVTSLVIFIGIQLGVLSVLVKIIKTHRANDRAPRRQVIADAPSGLRGGPLFWSWLVLCGCRSTGYAGNNEAGVGRRAWTATDDLELTRMLKEAAG